MPQKHVVNRYDLTAHMGRSVKDYVDRNEIDVLQSAFKAGPTVTALSGDAGTGKTWLALHFGMRSRSRYSDVFYARLPELMATGVGLKDLGQLVDRASKPFVIVDDVNRESRETSSFVASRKYRVSFLVVGRNAGLVEHEASLVLGGLSVHEIAKLVERKLGKSSSIHKFRLIRLLLSRVATRNAGEIAAKLRQFNEQVLRNRANANEPVIVETPGLLGPDGRPLEENSASYKNVVADVRGASIELLRILAARPKDLHMLSPRLFEEVVMEIFSRLGYSVALTPASRDGGKDIYAIRKDSVGTFLTLIECKKYAPDNPVGVELIRSLYGVVEEEKASAGILATTSYFTKGAKEFQHRVRFRIALQDFVGLEELLREATSN